MRFGNTPELTAAFESYAKRSMILLSDDSTKEMNQLVNDVYRETDLPFIFVEGSSGCGKTQLGMTLLIQSLQEGSMRKVYYLVCKNLGPESQPIYKYFAKPSSLFVKCYSEDLKTNLPILRSLLLDEEIYVFGFIDKLLFGDVYGSDKDLQIEKTKGNNLKQKIEDKWKVDERPVVVLDEFIPLMISNDESESNEDALNFIRNGFLAVGIIVIIMGTDARVANLIKRSKMSRPGDPYKWCYIFTELPKVIDTFQDAKISSLWHNILLHSRPLFAKKAFELLCVPDTNYSLNPNSLLKFLFDAFAYYKGIKKMIKGQLGQVAMSLNVCHIGAHDSKSTLFIHNHYARLLIKKKPMILQSNGILCGEDSPWDPETIFPSPSDDLLLHLVMLGGKDYRCIYVDGVPCPFRLRSERFLKDVSGRLWLQESDFSNAIQLSESGMKLEALLASSICLASRQNGLEGILLLDFFRNLMYELYDCELDFSQFKLQGTHWIEGFRSIKIPFYSAPNAEWPDFLLKGIDTVKNLKRCRNNDRMDVSGELRTINSNGKVSVEYLRGEAKDYNKGLTKDMFLEVLERITKNDKITIVLTTRLQNSDFKGKEFRDFILNNSLQDCRLLKLSTVNTTACFDKIDGIEEDNYSDDQMKQHNRLVIFVEIEIVTKDEHEGYSLRREGLKRKFP